MRPPSDEPRSIGAPAGRAGWLRRTAVLVLAAWLSASGAAAQETEVGFVQLTVNNTLTLPFFETYFGERETPYLSFDATMQAVEIPARYDPSLRSAIGFLADGSTRLIVNLEQGTVTVGERVIPLRPEDTRVIGHKLFVRYSSLGEWLPLEVSWSVAAYEVRIVTAYRLPSEERKRREQARRELLRSREEIDLSAVEAREVPWFDPGLFELSTTVAGGDGYPEQGRLGLRGVQRFLKGDLEYGMTQSVLDGERQAFRLDYTRLRYYDPLHTWEVALGDTFAGFSPLVLDTVSFRGGSFYTGGRRLRYGRTTLIGTAPPGSEVDLYRLGVLVDFTTAGEDGFYRFANVPLSLASTLFEIHIFTPQGRELVEYQQVSSQEQMVAPGRWATQGAAGRGRNSGNDFRLAGGEARFGVSPRLTLGVYALKLQDYTIALRETIDAEQTGGLFGLWRPVGWLLLGAEEARDTVQPGAARRLEAFFAFRPATVSLDWRHYTGEFAPPARTRSFDFSEPDRADSIAQVEVRTRLAATNVELRSRRTDFGETRTAIEHRVRMDRRFFRNLSLFATATRERHREAGFAGGGQDTLQALGSYRLTTLSRVEAFYSNSEVLGAGSFDQWRTTWLKNNRFGSPWAYSLSYLSFSNEENYTEGTVGYLFRSNLRLDARADTRDRWLVQLTYTLPFRVSGAGFEALPPNMFARAGLEGSVYLDENGDGAYQPGEETLPGVRVLAPGVPELVTDADGHFRGWGLPTASPATVRLDLFTTDALFMPRDDAIPVAPRPGELVRMDIPLVAAGGLEGAVRTRQPQQISPARGVELVLTDADGREVARAPVEWDGAFVVEQVPPGRYVLAGDPAQLAEAGLRLEPERRTIVLLGGAEPAWLSGIGFVALPAR